MGTMSMQPRIAAENPQEHLTLTGFRQSSVEVLLLWDQRSRNL
jgi:hypothetical protein